MAHNGVVMPRVLVVDNRDSFVHNVVDYLRQLQAEVDVVDGTGKQDSGNYTVSPAMALTYDGLLLSPGPGTPEQAVTSRHLVEQVDVPILGICLGHQVVAVSFGAIVTGAPELVHGEASNVLHDGQGVFKDLPNPFTAGRYHSLAVDPASVPPELEVSAWTTDGVIMGLRHRQRPIEGVQFHPESILTESGHDLLHNWLATL